MIKNTSFYKFFSIKEEDLTHIRLFLKREGDFLGTKGLILIGTEGINATVTGAESSLEQYKLKISGLFQRDFFFKDSEADNRSFKRLSVKIKKEIISVGRPDFQSVGEESRLTPEEWDRETGRNPHQILDIRNDYETDIGRFQNSKELKLKSFGEFPEKIKKSGLDRNKKTFIYCTGGIRCEKALEIMGDNGFKEVYQLRGGILNYLKERPGSRFEGECFVFDHRAALDQNLKPSRRFSLCPHCGQPGKIKTACLHCESPFTVCQSCLDTSAGHRTCSKNCAYHFKAGHKCRKKRGPFARQNTSSSRRTI